MYEEAASGVSLPQREKKRDVLSYSYISLTGYRPIIE
jgi:hypothetical protein